MIKSIKELIAAAQAVLDWHTPPCAKYEFSDCFNKKHELCMTCRLKKAVQEMKEWI